MKKIAIIQSNYIPWKGYFDIIARVDEFIFYDDVQYTRRDWRNRNLIKTSQGLKWLTIPVEVKGKFEQRICDAKINSSKWTDEHLKTIQHNYTKAKYYQENKDWLENLYEKAAKEKYLSQVNFLFIQEIMKFLEIKTQLKWSMDYHSSGSKTDRILDIAIKAKADVYLSGPSAKSYLQEEKFNQHGIQVEWMDYSGYPEYPQLYPPFEHGVSILDLLFNAGPNSRKYLKYCYSETFLNDRL
jgi:hypothetical protein